MGRWDSGWLIDLDQLDNPEPSRADRERLLWSQNEYIPTMLFCFWATVNDVGLKIKATLG